MSTPTKQLRTISTDLPLKSEIPRRRPLSQYDFEPPAITVRPQHSADLLKNELLPSLQSLVQLPDSFFLLSPPKNSYRPTFLSPNSDNGHFRNGSDVFYGSRSGSPVRKDRNLSPKRSPRRSSSSSTNPFNYGTVTMTNTLLKPSHRKGHRYKHSSVLMNFFQEPKKRANFNIPTSLPVPGLREFLELCSYPQKLKLVLCGIHLLYASAVFIAGVQYSMSCLTTLSHLVFFDGVNNVLTVVVDIFRNFEAWDRLLITRPFGLSRIEPLFGFALSVSLFYVGFDLVTHLLEEFVVSIVDGDLNHDNHHGHNEHRTLPDGVFLVLVAIGIGITLVGNQVLSSDAFKLESESKDNLDLNEDILKPKIYNRVSGIKRWLKQTGIVYNPVKTLTLAFLCYLVFFPAISRVSSTWKLSEIQTFLMALLILYAGFQMIKRLSQVILLAFPYSSAVFKRCSNNIKESIVQLDSFKSNYSVKKVLISKVNYSLFVVLVKVSMIGGTDDEELALRNDLCRVIRSGVLKEGLERAGVDFDITVDIDRM